MSLNPSYKYVGLIAHSTLNYVKTVESRLKFQVLVLSLGILYLFLSPLFIPVVAEGRGRGNARWPSVSCALAILV